MDEHWGSSGSSFTNTGPGNPTSPVHTPALLGARTRPGTAGTQGVCILATAGTWGVYGHFYSEHHPALRSSQTHLQPGDRSRPPFPMFAPFLGLLTLAGGCPRGAHPPAALRTPGKAPRRQSAVTMPRHPGLHSAPPSVTLDSRASVSRGITRRSLSPPHCSVLRLFRSARGSPSLSFYRGDRDPWWPMR